MSSSSHAPPPYAALHAGPALREHASTSFFSPYRKFWRGTNWHKFLLPPKAIPGGQHIASQDPEAAFEAAVAFATKEKVNATLKGWPAVYEFAIVHPRNPKRVKVYVGKASGRGPADNPSAGGLKQRQGDYLNPKKNHIKDLMGQALADGCMIVRRFRYILFEDCSTVGARSAARRGIRDADAGLFRLRLEHPEQQVAQYARADPHHRLQHRPVGNLLRDDRCTLHITA